MKKIINRPEDVVREELQGIEAAHADLVKVFFDPYYIVRADAPVTGWWRIADLAELPALLSSLGG